MTTLPNGGNFFKNHLVRNYRAECSENNIGAFGTCLDVKLCSAWRLAPGKGGLRGRGPLFCHKTPKPLLPNCPSGLNRIWYEASEFGMRNQGN